jgi:hypothetical protein
MVADEAGRAADRVARESYGRLVAFLAARTRDVAGAEDALNEAFAAALRKWPVDGVPDNPDAWLLTAARRQQTDADRRRQTRKAGEEHVQLIGDEIAARREPLASGERSGAERPLPDRGGNPVRSCRPPPDRHLQLAGSGRTLRLEDDKRMLSYQPYWAAKSHLFSRAGDTGPWPSRR